MCISGLSEGLNEYELDEDLEVISYLLTETQKRFSEFQKARDANTGEYVKGKKKFAENYFSKPLQLHNL